MIGRVAATSLAATAVLTIVIALVVRPEGPLPRSQTVLIGGALVALCCIGALKLASLWWPTSSRARLLDRVAAPRTRAEIWLALAVWFPTLLIPVYLKALGTEPPSVQWLGYGYLDKRWESSAYLLGTLAPMLLLVAAARVLDVGRGHPQSWRAWLRGVTATGRATEVTAPNARWVTVVRVALGVASAVALAYYFYGPPWYLDRYTGGIDYHEDIHFGGLQAISEGLVPYIGPAAIQYGPGAQLLSYLYMHHIGTFSVLGARESWALFHWLGATIFFAAVFLGLGYVRGLVASLAAALIYPTLQLFGFEPGGTWAGFFGWANILRSAGAFALLLLLSRTSSALAVGTALLTVLAGFTIVWLPALGYYAVAGVLDRFVWLYFFVPLSVANGYSNTAFYEGPASPWGPMFYMFPFVLAALALLSVLRFRPFGIAIEWSRARTQLVTTLVTTIALYSGALLRSDTPHLIGTMLPVPAFLIVVATTLPWVVGARRRATLAVAGAVLVAVASVLVPPSAFELSGVKARLEAPYLDRQRLAEEPRPVTPATAAGMRVGVGLSDAPICCMQSTASMPTFVLLMDRIHAIVGDRVTYVVDFPDAYPGLVYFVADLDPAPIPLEKFTMILTQPQRLTFLADFEERVLPQTEALLTSSLSANETQSFLMRYKDARQITLSYRGEPYYVMLR